MLKIIITKRKVKKSDREVMHNRAAQHHLSSDWPLLANLPPPQFIPGYGIFWPGQLSWPGPSQLPVHLLTARTWGTQHYFTEGEPCSATTTTSLCSQCHSHPKSKHSTASAPGMKINSVPDKSRTPPQGQSWHSMWRVCMLCNIPDPTSCSAVSSSRNTRKICGFSVCTYQGNTFQVSGVGVSSLKLSFWTFCFVESSGFNKFHHDFSSSRRLSKTKIAKLTSGFLCTPFVTQVCKISLHFQIEGIICPGITYPSHKHYQSGCYNHPTAKSQIFQLSPTLQRASTTNTNVQPHHSLCQAKQAESGLQKTACMLGKARRVQNRCSVLTTKYFLAGEMVQLS